MKGPPPEPLQGARTVNHGLQVTVFTLLFGIAIPLMALQELVMRGWESQIVLVGAALLAGPPAWWVLLEARFRLVVSPTGIEARSVIGERRSLPWDSIRRVEFGSITRTLVLYADGVSGSDPGSESLTSRSDPGARPGPVVLRVSLLRRGIESLGRAIPQYLPEEIYGEAWEEMFGGRRD